MNRILLAFAALTLSALPAHAHPHVFVDMFTEIELTPEGLVKGVNLKWSFDDAYAAVALEGMDTDGDGKYSSDELAQLTKENLESIADYGFFTVMRHKGIILEGATPGASNQTYDDGKLRLTFELLLKQPVDPKAGEFQVKVYDPEFYIGFNYPEQGTPYATTGALPAGCKADLKPLLSNDELEAKRTYLAEKPVGWKPPPGEEQDFGALFAQPLVVQCS